MRAWLQEHCPAPAANERLEEHLEAIAQACAGSPFCSVENVRGERFLQLCGKLHATTTRMMELARRVEAEFERDGAAADCILLYSPQDVRTQHYAFLVEEDEFDGAFERLKKSGAAYFADHDRSGKGEINHHWGGRGVYFMKQVMDSVELKKHPEGSTLVLVKHWKTAENTDQLPPV